MLNPIHKLTILVNKYLRKITISKLLSIAKLVYNNYE